MRRRLAGGGDDITEFVVEQHAAPQYRRQPGDQLLLRLGGPERVEQMVLHLQDAPQGVRLSRMGLFDDPIDHRHEGDLTWDGEHREVLAVRLVDQCARHVVGDHAEAVAERGDTGRDQLAHQSAERPGRLAALVRLAVQQPRREHHRSRL